MTQTLRQKSLRFVYCAFAVAYPPDLYPKVADWKARLNGDPGVAATIPAHWGATPLHRETA